ncbi:MAG: lysophospholipid acyltransferase family protein [Alphaproteobacteria bacterium]|nr:lysophospholipid acyltransferase family protein [Alphaproteobacteria bacterium]
MASADSTAAGPPISYVLSLARIAVYFAWTAALIPVQAVAHVASPRLTLKIPLFYHRVCCRIFGLGLEVVGRRARLGPVLYVANHISYLDISVYGALIEGSFVAKREVAGWPLFGLLAKLQRTVFIDRSRGTALAQVDTVRERLEAGGNVILFPEGTSGDGNRVLPFHSSLLGVVEKKGVSITVQPVTLTYTKLDGMPLGRGLRPFIAWYGDMGMAGHFVQLLGLGRITARVEFHDAVPADRFTSRKELARHCFDTVSAAHAAALGGYAKAGRRPGLRRRRR